MIEEIIEKYSNHPFAIFIKDSLMHNNELKLLNTTIQDINNIFIS